MLLFGLSDGDGCECLNDLAPYLGQVLVGGREPADGFALESGIRTEHDAEARLAEASASTEDVESPLLIDDLLLSGVRAV